MGAAASEDDRQAHILPVRTKGEIALNSLAFERDEVHRIRLHVLPTDRFKTFGISLYIGRPLERQSVTATALTPFVLRRGTQSYPETRQFRERLDDLFGAGFGFDIYKRGDNQIVQFRMDVIDDRFVSGDTASLLRQSLEFIGEVIARPATDDGRFRDKYVAAEKNTLQKRLEAIINDKIKYAAERCVEEMCVNEPYRFNPLGRVEDLPELDSAALYERYVQWLRTAPMDLYVVGNTSMEEVKPIVAGAFSALARSGPATYGARPSHVRVDRVRTVVERLDVSQGKLNMGLRTGIDYTDADYPAALMYNGVLGAYPHSKLFINVREKASLAYYAASRLDGHKGIMTIQSGIEIDRYDRAVEIIRKQLEEMAEGRISDLEMEQTQAMISNQLREIHDSAFEMIAFDFNSVLSGQERSVPGLLEAIAQVDREAIRRTAGRIELDTIYFLRDRKGE